MVSGKNLEELTEKWSNHYGKVWVICGPLISKGKVKLWLGEEGLIRGNGIIFIIFQTGAGEDCKVSGRTWDTPGDWVVCYRNWYWQKHTVPFKSFRGIRYIDRLPEPIQPELKTSIK